LGVGDNLDTDVAIGVVVKTGGSTCATLNYALMAKLLKPEG
jgi:hypothetical protein